MVGSKWFKRLLTAALMAGSFSLVNGCDGWVSENISAGPNSVQRNLNILVHPGKFSYYKTSLGIEGLEADILTQFATDRGYKIKWTTVKTEGEGLLKMRQGNFDLFSGRIPTHWIQENEFLAEGPAYDQSRLVLVCPKKQKVEDSLFREFPGNSWNNFVTSRKQAPPVARARFRQKFTNTILTEYVDDSAFKLLRRVSQGQFSCALLDSADAAFEVRKFASLEIKKEFGEGSSYHFLINRKNADLERELLIWVLKSSRRGDLETIRTRYDSHLTTIHSIDVRHYYRAVREKLPRYLKDLKNAGNETGLPWQLIAAVAYQESHWEPEARSHTGVRGFMQLTRDTAEHMGVEDRLNPSESIRGGAKYLKWLWDMAPDGLPARERMALTLAAYNVGLGHLDDIQEYAEKDGQNPFTWKTLKAALPLLENPDISANFNHGPARGNETVDFVHSVMNFYDLTLNL